MKALIGLVLLVASCWSAEARGPHTDRADPLDLRYRALPATDADLARAEHSLPGPGHTLFGDMADRLGVQDGGAVLFRDQNDLQSGRGFSGTVDTQGARLRLRW